MPKIPQYISQQGADAVNFRTRAPKDRGLDWSLPAAAVGDVMKTAEQLRIVQEREAEKLRIDETRMRVANTMSEAQVTWLERLTQAKDSAPKDAAGFTDSTLKDFDAWAKTRTDQEADPQGLQLLQANLRDMRTRLHADAFAFEVKQRKTALVDSAKEGIAMDRRALTAEPSSFVNTLAMRLATLDTLDLPAPVREDLKTEARRTMAFDAANALVDQSPSGFLEMAGMRSSKGPKGKTGARAEDAADRVASSPLLSSMAPEDLRRTVDRASMLVAQQEAAAAAEAERRQRAAEAEAARRERLANQSFTILSSIMRDGRKLDTASPNVKTYMRNVEGTPYAAEVERMMREAPDNASTAVRPLREQQAQLDALYARRNVAGASPELESEIKRVEGVVKASQQDYEREPLRAAVERGINGVQVLAPVDLTNLDALVSTVGTRVQQADIVRGYAGKAVSPLTHDEAAAVQKWLAAVPPNQFGAGVARLASAIPPTQLQALAQQMDARDRPLALALAAGSASTTQGRTVAELIRSGAQVLKDKGIKEEGGAEFGIQAQIAKEVGDAVPQAARKDVIDAARYISAAKQFEGETISVAGAVRLAIGGNIVEHNGRRVPVPAGMDENALRARLEQYPMAEIQKQADADVVYLPGRRPMGVPEFMAALPSAQLEPAGLGRFYVRSGGSLVLGKDGAPVSVSVR